jgi:hypothetical protein
LAAGTFLASFNASAMTLNIVAGGLTLTGVADPSVNFLGLDLRGTVGLAIDMNGLLVTDEFSSPDFGNLTLAGIPPVLDGTAVLLTFPSASLHVNPDPFSVSLLSEGTVISGPLSPAEQVLLDPIQWVFDFVSTTPYNGGPDQVITFSLASVVDEAPEPATWLYVLSAGLVIAVARYLRLSRN